MKTSKLFITSLLAAAAMSVPAFAADYTVANGAIKDSSNKVASNGASGATINGEVNTTGVAVNAGDNFTFDNVTGYLPGWNNGTFAGNVVLTGGGLTINDGFGKGYTFFSGFVSGNGSFIVDANNNPAKGQDFIFTGNLTAFTGSFSRPVANYTAGKENAYNELDAGILQFGGTVSSNGIGSGTAYVASATAGADGIVHNISGQGSITTTSVLRYNYTGSANAGVTALGIDNSSISARYVDFRGGANYTVSSTLTGNNTTASNNTLTISAGTTTFTGSIANFGTITVASGATADFSNTTFKLGAVSADSVTTTISNSGTVTFGEGTIFDVDSAASLVRGAQLLGGMSGQTQTFTIANLSVGGYLVNQRGSATFSVSESGVLTLDSYTASDTNYSLTWNGGDSGVWKANGTGWTTTDTTGEVTFQNGDSVTFGAGTDNNVTVADNLKVGTMTVSAATSLTGTGSVRVDAANLTTTAALTLGENVILDLGSISDTATKTVLGTGTVKVATGSNFKGVSLGADFTGTIEHSGNIDANTFAGNQNAKYVLSSGRMWGGATLINISNDICFANYQIGNTGTTKVNFTGALTQADGTTLTIGGNANTTATFSGAGTVISDLRISAGTLTMNAGQATIKGSQSLVGNLNINNGATVYVAQNDSLSYGSSNTVTVNQGGVLSFGNYRWTVGANNKIVINGGEISGAGEGSNGALDFYQANPAAVTARSGSTSTISAAIRLRNANQQVFTTEANAVLTLSGLINGAGTLVKAGNGELIVSGANVYTGGTTINGGVLTVKNATALGTTAGTTTVNSGGVLKIAVNGGLTAGTVTLNEGALLAIDLTAYSNIEEGTALTIISSSAISFNSQEFSSDLMENTFFDLENSDLGSWSSYLREWSYDTTNGLQLTLTIPEPSMFGLLAGLGALALAGTRRRRRKA